MGGLTEEELALGPPEAECAEEEEWEEGESLDHDHAVSPRVEDSEGGLETCSRPVKVKHVTVAFPMGSRAVGEVLHALNFVTTQFKSMGLYVDRMHSDKARELIAKPVQRWAAARGIVQTTTGGDDPAAAGHVESEVNQLKRRMRFYLRRASLTHESWPLALRFAVEERRRFQLNSLGTPTLPMVPFYSPVVVKRKRWHNPGTLAPPFVSGTLISPPPLMHHGWAVRTSEGLVVHVREAVVPSPLGETVALEFQEVVDKEKPPEMLEVPNPEVPPHRLTGKQPMPHLPENYRVVFPESATPATVAGGENGSDESEKIAVFGLQTVGDTARVDPQTFEVKTGGDTARVDPQTFEVKTVDDTARVDPQTFEVKTGGDTARVDPRTGEVKTVSDTARVDPQTFDVKTVDDTARVDPQTFEVKTGGDTARVDPRTGEVKTVSDTARVDPRTGEVKTVSDTARVDPQTFDVKTVGDTARVDPQTGVGVGNNEFLDWAVDSERLVGKQWLEEVWVGEHGRVSRALEEAINHVPIGVEEGSTSGEEIGWLIRTRDELEGLLKDLQRVDRSEGLKIQAVSVGDQGSGEDEVLQTTVVSLDEVRKNVEVWKSAMMNEYRSLTEETHAIEPIDEKDLDDQQVELVPGKLVCTLKAGPNGGKRKCRAVICGNLLDDVKDPCPSSYASGADGLLIRATVKHGVDQGWGITTTDVKTAFLLAPRPRVEGTREVIIIPPKILMQAGV